MAKLRRRHEGGGADAFESHDTPEPPVADPSLTPLPGPQVDAVEPGRGAPAPDPRGPSGPVRARTCGGRQAPRADEAPPLVG